MKTRRFEAVVLFFFFFLPPSSLIAHRLDLRLLMACGRVDSLSCCTVTGGFDLVLSLLFIPLNKNTECATQDSFLSVKEL